MNFHSYQESTLLMLIATVSCTLLLSRREMFVLLDDDYLSYFTPFQSHHPLEEKTLSMMVV